MAGWWLASMPARNNATSSHTCIIKCENQDTMNEYVQLYCLDCCISLDVAGSIYIFFLSHNATAPSLSQRSAGRPRQYTPPQEYHVAVITSQDCRGYFNKNFSSSNQMKAFCSLSTRRTKNGTTVTRSHKFKHYTHIIIFRSLLTTHRSRSRQ